LALAKDLEVNYGLDTVVVDPDKIREMIPALMTRFDPRREYLVESLALTIIDESLKRHNIVISDDLNYYESTRHRLMRVARRHKVRYVIICLTVSIETALERNKTRETPIPGDLIAKIAEEFDMPGAKYGWDRPSLVIDSEKSLPSEAERQALQVLLEEVKKKTGKTRIKLPGSNLSRVQKKPNDLTHEKSLDEATRRALNQLLSSRELDPSKSKQANNIRREYLHEASDKNLSIQEALKQFRRILRERLHQNMEAA
jgi:tRNA uridine 5-carbamoylmethylation protein Kti12